MQDDENKNLMLAMALSALVIIGWFLIFPPEPPVDQQALSESQLPPAMDPQRASPSLGTQPDESIVATAPAAGETSAPVDIAETIGTRENALTKTDRIAIKTPRLDGSISLKGARIDDLHLTDYNVRLNDPSEKITLLSPTGGPKAYYALHGWTPYDSLTYNDVPHANTEWAVESGDIITEATPVTLKWENDKGLIFRRTISVDDNYMFNIEQSVENTTGEDVRLAPYGIIARQGEPETIGFYILHEGVVRASDGEIEEIDYDDMPDEATDPRENAAISAIDVEANGWIGFTDKYWMTTLIPNAGQAFKSVSKYTAGNDTYQTDARLPSMVIPAGATQGITTSLFAGAKEYEIIKDYEINANVGSFIDSIDWGWFFFLTKPIFLVLHLLNNLIGNMGIAIIGLTLLIKALLFPLAYKSYVSMARMKELQPEMEKLKEKHGEDKQAMQKGVLALYKEKKVNPAAGCLPILLQIPIFFSLYKVIFVTIEMYHAPFIGWIHDLSAPDPSSFLNMFGLFPWGTPEVGTIFAFFSIGVYPILMGITMWLQQKLNPAPTDKTQAQIFAWLPWVFMFMLGQFAAGLVIYWVANNTITFIQQYTIMRSQGVKPDILGNIFSRLKKEEAESK